MTQPHTRKAVGRDSRLSVSAAIALTLVVVFAQAVASFVDSGTWAYDFFFHRGFVQWILLLAFATGSVHLIRRIPVTRRERRALVELRTNGAVAAVGTAVSRRWAQVVDSRKTRSSVDLMGHHRALADHDEAELEAAYRVIGDIVQVLPLMGFFGTVFGLSRGLYQSFLQTGGTSTKDFAKALAIAFDNTLLGLALTILLFIAQSLLRKRDDATMLELNLYVSSTEPFSATVDPSVEGMREVTAALWAHHAAMELHRTEVTRVRSALDGANSTAREIAAALKESSEVFTGLVREHAGRVGTLIADEVRGTGATIREQLASELREWSVEWATAARRGAAGVLKLATELGDELRQTREAVASVGATVGQLSVSEVAAAVTTLTGVLESCDKKVVDAVIRLESATQEHATTLKGIAAGVDQVGQLASQQLTSVTALQETLQTQSDDIMREIRSPRTLTILEGRPGPPQEGHAS